MFLVLLLDRQVNFTCFSWLSVLCTYVQLMVAVLPPLLCKLHPGTVSHTVAEPR